MRMDSSPLASFHNPLFGLVELVADPFRQLRDHLAEMIDDGVEQFDRAAIERAGGDRAADIFDGTQRRAPHGHQQPLGHAEAQAAQLLGRMVEFELQIGNDADDFAAIDLEALMVLVTEQDVARDLGQRRMAFDPLAAAGVGVRQVDPEPAVARCDGGVDRVGRQAVRPCRRRRSDRPTRCRPRDVLSAGGASGRFIGHTPQARVRAYKG